MSTTQIWNEFSDRIYYFILSRVDDKEIAKDLLQEVFIKIHTKLDTLNDQSSLSSWMFTVTRNTVYDYYRQKKSRQKEQAVLKDNAHLFEDDELNRLCETCLHLFVQDLPEKYREAILATDLGNLSQKEYAKKIGISYPGLKSRVQRGRAKLNEYFKECCLSTNSKGESDCTHKDKYACTC
ncbi:MAG: sigma-70 family RNA polymerase sigma factor [Balneola sp.]